MHLDEQDDSVIHKYKISDINSFVNLVNYAQEHRKSFLWGFVLLLGSSIFIIFSARLMGEMVEKGLSPGDKNAAFTFAGLVILAELFGLLTQWGGRKIMAQGASKTIYLIREKLFSHLQKLPIRYYDRQPQGRIVTRITHDVEGIEEFFSSSLGRLANALFSAGISLIAMLVTDFKLGGILVLTALPCFLFIAFTKDKVRELNRRISRYSSALNAKLSEFVNGIDVIRSYGLEDWSKDHYDQAVDSHHQSQLAANKMFAFIQPTTSFLVALPLIGLVGFGGQQVLAGTLSVGLFVTFVRYCERFFMPIMMLAREVHVIQQAFTSAERVSNFLKEDGENEVLGGGEVIPQQNLSGDLHFEDVWMAYNPGEWILKGLSFNIQSGEKVGLVGTTGCGKTSTISLLLRLYDYQKGQITLDGHDLKDLERNWVRSQLGLVSQDVIIFKGTWRQNLSADAHQSDETLLKACEETGLLDVMRQNDLSLDSWILESGANMSSGERQLLALTRVLLNNPSILILDEATAHIDPHYESIIQGCIEKLMKKKTCLVIAHRLETIMNCDRLLVFESGRIVERGTPKDLLSQTGYFHKLQSASQVQANTESRA
jgi:ABC-type multidrug transport system fused ATPase/permease subunit